MEWYGSLKSTRTAGSPQYLQERVSDLKHVADLAKTSPREAKRVLSHVISQLEQHHTTEFTPSLVEAGRVMLDSPARAILAINHIVAAIMEERERIQEAEEAERENPWKKLI